VKLEAALDPLIDYVQYLSNYEDCILFCACELYILFTSAFSNQSYSSSSLPPCP